MAQKKKRPSKSEYRVGLEAELKPKLQRANMMLLNLERLAKESEFAGIEQFSYSKAMRVIKETRGEGYKRFNMPKNTHQMEKVLSAVDEFLESPTSSKKGIEELYEKNANFFNEQFGSKYSWQKMGSFLKAAGFEDLKTMYLSTKAIQIVGEMYKHRRKTGKKKFIEMLEKHQISELDEVDQDVLADFIKSNVKWTDLR